MFVSKRLGPVAACAFAALLTSFALASFESQAEQKKAGVQEDKETPEAIAATEQAFAKKSDSDETPTKLVGQDPPFDTYVNLDLLLPAVRALDSDTLVDLTIQMTEGERILGRPHKAIAAKHVAEKALSIAAATGSKSSLARMKKWADDRGDKALAKRIANAEEDARGTRAFLDGAVNAPEKSELEVADSIEGYEMIMKSLIGLGDRTEVDGVIEELKGASFLPEAQRKALLGKALKLKSTLGDPTETDDILRDLAGASRSNAFSIGKVRKWEMPVGVRVGNTDGWRSNQSVYSPAAGWVVNGSAKVKFTSRFGHTDYNVKTTRRNWTYATSADVRSEYKGLLDIAAKYKLYSYAAKLKAEQSEYSGYATKASTSHASVILTVSAKGEGFLRGGSSIQAVAYGTETYVGTKADIRARATYHRSQMKK